MPIDAVHAHLVLNHFPVVGSILVLLLVAYALLRRKDESMRVALAGTTLIGLIAVVVYLTGEPAEESVEHLAGISERLIESHEEAALFATVASAFAAVAALVTLLFFRKRPIPMSALGLVLVLALAGTVSLGFTAWRGGQIRHSEIRSGAPAAASVAGMDSERVELDDD